MRQALELVSLSDVHPDAWSLPCILSVLCLPEMRRAFARSFAKRELLTHEQVVAAETASVSKRLAVRHWKCAVRQGPSDFKSYGSATASFDRFLVSRNGWIRPWPALVSERFGVIVLNQYGFTETGCGSAVE
ncbi:MAG: hypothetical protein IJU76_14575 [Desulfovibrionaceae bacterium]|nr:hypothetical protein [Desulfovibrionaceae bacterium]